MVRCAKWAWLVNCCQLLLAICLFVPLQTLFPSTPHDVEPASRIFLRELLAGCLLASP